MTTLIRAFCCMAMLAAATALAADHVTTIRTRDGRVLKGKVLQETTKGYLLRTETKTELIEYGAVDDIKLEGEAPSVPPPPPRELAVPMPPPPPPTTTAPITPAPIASAPPGEPAGQLSGEVTPKEEAWAEARRGVHFGFGAGGVVLPWAAFTSFPVSGGARAQFHVNFGFGAVEVRVSPTLGVLYTEYRGFNVVTVHVAFEATARYNIGRVYALGLGTYQGFAFGSAGGCIGDVCSYASGVNLFFSPVLYPAIFRFGEKSQNEVTLGLMFPVNLTPEVSGSPYPFVMAAFHHVF